MGALNKVLVNYLQKSRPPSRVTGTEALEGHSQLQVRSQGPLRTPCIRGTPSPLLSLSLQWRLQEAERPHQFSKARMKGIFTAAGMLISFGTEITTPSLIRSRELLLHLLGRRAGGWEGVGGERAVVLRLSPAHCPLGCCRLLLSHGAAHSRLPSRSTSTKVKSTTWMLQRRTLTRHR